MGRKLCVINQKGGVGKTTSVMNIGIGMKNTGKRVLLIDLDPQANLTSALGFQSQQLESTVYEWMKGETSFEDTVLEYQSLFLIPSNVELSAADIELSQVTGRELLLKKAIDSVLDRFDYILIDCSPTLGLLALNALTAVDEVIVPIQPEYLPLEGVSYLMKTIELVRERLNHDLKVGGVIVTRYEGRKNLHREVVDILRTHFEDKLFNTFIRNNVALAEAPSYRKDIFTYKPDSNGAQDYEALCKEILIREVV